MDIDFKSLPRMIQPFISSRYGRRYSRSFPDNKFKLKRVPIAIAPLVIVLWGNDQGFPSRGGPERQTLT